MKLYKNIEWQEVILNGEKENIPTDWVHNYFSFFGKFVTGKDYKKNIGTEYPIYGSSETPMKLSSSVYIYNNPTFIIGRKGTIDKPFKIDIPFWCVDTAMFFDFKNQQQRDFIFYKAKLVDWYKYNDGSTVPSLVQSKINKISISHPKTDKEQSAIASILSSQESIISKTKDLIANLDKRNQFMMDELLSGRLRVKEENGQPVFYKNADDNWQTIKINGEDVDIPKDWDSFKLKGNIDIKTGKKDANVAKKDGQYAFFTCGKQVLKTDTYDFDCEAILIAGNGDVGETKYYHGKFDAYQRTYVLSNYKHDLKFLYIYMNKLFKDSISALGSAMPYIKLGYLEDFSVNQPQDFHERELVLKIIISLIEEKEKYAQILQKEENTFTFLLEELMSGRLRVGI